MTSISGGCARCATCRQPLGMPHRATLSHITMHLILQGRWERWFWVFLAARQARKHGGLPHCAGQSSGFLVTGYCSKGIRHDDVFPVLQYKKDPRTGQLYGLFGIFDGETLAVPCSTYVSTENVVCGRSGRRYIRPPAWPAARSLFRTLFPFQTGHGGPHAADYVRSNLFVNMMQRYVLRP